jgi:hypothetical protein
MHEQSFSLRVPGSYERSRKLQKEVIARHSTEAEAYREHHKAGFSFWADCWGNNGAGRAFDVEDFETNYYTPLEMAYSIHWALAYSDKYVWMWPGAINWWNRTVNTVNDAGEEVTVPLPHEYVEALELAHQPTVPEPPRDRKPNTWRIESASKWKNWKDDDVFGDLWNEYEFVADLPLAWNFALDPDEEGLEEGYEKPGFDDSGWRKIKIREFWEPQCCSPYDGQAWYRVTMKSPEIPADAGNLLLAFGAVADEATVYVNGSKVYASVPGDNIRHKRFLVDVTDVWKPGEENQVTVRVWNVSWCGGIWKNVKLIAEKK